MSDTVEQDQQLLPVLIPATFASAKSLLCSKFIIIFLNLKLMVARKLQKIPSPNNCKKKQ